MNQELTNRIAVPVRFSEVDSMHIVWHGHYIRFFEDGREAFGKEHHISYLDVKSHGFTIPIVKVDCEYKLPLAYGDIATVESTFVACAAAKIQFRYRILNQHEQVVATGSTLQVFLDEKGELQLLAPDFFVQWKQGMGLI